MSEVVTESASTPRSTAPVIGGGRVSVAPRIRPGWPLTALLVLYPLWWALGLGTLILFVLTVPMVAHLRHRRIAVPPGFGLWMLFLVWAVASAAMLQYDPPGVAAGAASKRLVTVVFTLACYAAVTVVLLYVGNLTEEEFPRQKLIRQLGALFCTVVAGGVLGTVAPHFQFTAPFEMLLPGSVRSNGFVQSLVHPTAAQVQSVLGFDSGRPAAPFGYTNMWGNCLVLLLAWFAIGWLRGGTRERRILGGIILAVAAVPTVYSLNRGMWLGLGVAMLFMLLRLLGRGSLAAAGAMIAAATVIGVALVASPLSTIIQDRLAHPHSNETRAFTTERTLDAVTYSPLLGYGSTRQPLGNGSSIAVGASANCPRCGSPPLGSNGQLWAILIMHGIGGVVLFVGFFLRGIWAYRRDRTPIGDAGLLALVLSLFFMFVYNALAIPLLISFISLGLLWRNDRDGRSTGSGLPRARYVSFARQQ
ncbi:MAG TPA: hypothetical protein VGN19_12980 [Pedococcus sp.]|jgi:hypothetical protein|nr:hypothetical protein [Pedococcus sp.]